MWLTRSLAIWVLTISRFRRWRRMASPNLATRLGGNAVSMSRVRYSSSGTSDLSNASLRSILLYEISTDSSGRVRPLPLEARSVSCSSVGRYSMARSSLPRPSRSLIRRLYSAARS
ncbi:hypothetical protein PFLmoz3_02481 [Pseudomonas fluorescens]|uniref:Uncharacterized protein n=1 Tax=Pseudomonas fluorescens TaxID=294 RepID=A0A109LH62_PSEFL|nr:hypothetical protein PFLmoz3_02481 [Pseudomonas fluorescens]